MTTVWRVMRFSYDDQETVAVCASYDDAVTVWGQQKHRTSCGIEKLTVGEGGEDFTPEPVLYPQPLSADLKQWQKWGAKLRWHGSGFYVPESEERRILMRTRSRASGAVT